MEDYTELIDCVKERIEFERIGYVNMEKNDIDVIPFKYE